MDNRFKEPHSHPRWWYEDKGIPQCFDCEHFRGAVNGKIRCEAFPTGIPAETWVKAKAHNLPHECNSGYKYNPIK